ncbi:MAG: cob(I)yrinic acid a,c-diamide adenosyltransferase [Bacteroidia bacterium]|jgi:cob(I)alamin adenosyltransferase|nr:cob(I)yrinic acid a,c-diamide adenosyltransferase [Bacteroidales bacterium]MDD3299749.1 cob(I)yrinic acid a,c-diamide adenosyltransferase [Bacteroidales bacterium]MDD3843326.1 cob(I)yrinic acid a,c-diamide adenosyltransferase [Bacteroidales bacterium]MDD4617599.1 cob(I)yrinic acid a,c-diamide adenosyltransferase [Bacteroidales bacterium]NCC45754.1 cob(I)yrinic acid a,c-diamide adenosyltransferase [Bacteroidia bacterium]
MKVYTKTGDKGQTSLVGGARVSKDDKRVNAYGNVDELISFIALIRDSTKGKAYHENLRRIQSNLMLVAAHLAADSTASAKLKDFDLSEIEYLEQEIDKMTEELPEQKAFILPAGPRCAAECHIARTVCRRAERSAIPIMTEPRLEYPVKYLNRLSDYLYVYARYLSMKEGTGDDFWYQ